MVGMNLETTSMPIPRLLNTPAVEILFKKRCMSWIILGQEENTQQELDRADMLFVWNGVQSDARG